MVTIDDVRTIAAGLERSYEVFVRGRVKFRVGQIVFLAFSSDERMMGFAFPKDERAALVASEPDKFMLPEPGDMRYQWVVVRLDCIDLRELRELVEEAWAMVVPKKVWGPYFERIMRDEPPTR
ncbi:MAG: MmcQ/YjbR family DNA-binding protein [Ilumatobacteraceae bacterium]